jgi:hypothetical protein
MFVSCTTWSVCGHGASRDQDPIVALEDLRPLHDDADRHPPIDAHDLHFTQKRTLDRDQRGSRGLLDSLINSTRYRDHREPVSDRHHDRARHQVLARRCRARAVIGPRHAFEWCRSSTDVASTLEGFSPLHTRIPTVRRGTRAEREALDIGWIERRVRTGSGHEDRFRLHRRRITNLVVCRSTSEKEQDANDSHSHEACDVDALIATRSRSS